MVKKLTKVELRYYAQLREALHASREEVEIGLPATEMEILSELAGRHPLHGKLIQASRLAVNDEYLPHGTVIRELSTADLISPVSGG